MNKLKRLIKEDYQKKYNVSFTCSEAKSRLNIDGNYKEEKERNFSFMKKWKIFTSVAVLVVLVAVIVGFSVFGGKKETYSEQEITIDHNPSVSLTTDKDGKVNSVHGNNDEGKMIISGEAFIGLEAEEAVKKILAIEVECGYFVKGEDKDINGLQISVSVSSDIDPEKVVSELEAYVSTELNKLGVKVSEELKVVADKAHEALVAKACELDPTLVKEEVAKLSDDKIVALISASYLDTVKIPSEELEAMYKYFKEYQFNLAQSEVMQSINGGIITANTALQARYEELKAKTAEAFANLQAKYQEFFVNADSDYQVALKKLNDAKDEILALRAEVANMEEGAAKTAKELILDGKEAALNGLKLALQTAAEACKAALDASNALVNSAFDVVDNLLMTNEELNNLLVTNEANISKKANELKDAAFTKFEDEYAEQLTAEVNKMVARKAALVEQMKQYAK